MNEANIVHDFNDTRERLKRVDLDLCVSGLASMGSAVIRNEFAPEKGMLFSLTKISGAKKGLSGEIVFQCRTLGEIRAFIEGRLKKKDRETYNV